MYWLSDKIEFPPYKFTSSNGIIALGGDLSSERLIHAYERGIFPWYSEDEPIIWHCPHQRMVLFPVELKISKSMKQILKKCEFTITENKAFEEVIFNCRHIDRQDGLGTWITNEMEQAYVNLYKLGKAKSIEVWNQKKELVGGLYGIEVGKVFCGESMFSKTSNMSKVAFAHLAQNGGYKLIDCQVYTNHLASLGAREIPRNEFLEILKTK